MNGSFWENKVVGRMSPLLAGSDSHPLSPMMSVCDKIAGVRPSKSHRQNPPSIQAGGNGWVGVGRGMSGV